MKFRGYLIRYDKNEEGKLTADEGRHSKKMKIGIITFHWAANYGAVLQAYALQEYLKRKGQDVEIIDYVPKGYTYRFFECFMSRSIDSFKYKFRDYKKRKKINENINRYLTLSKKYSSYKEFYSDIPQYDIYLTGSDQVWNEDFTLRGEGKLNLAYFFDFIKDKKKISYATSAGSCEFSDEYWNAVLPCLHEYDDISVREESLALSLGKKGISAKVVPDPTLLLHVDDYEQLTVETIKSFKFVYYILQNEQKNAFTIKNYYTEKYGDVATKDINGVSLGEWLEYIKKAELVMTNSYHGTIFSVLNHKNFLVVPIEGKLEGMNDRVYTLLSKLKLSDRIVTSIDEAEKLSNIPINWGKVDLLLEKYRQEGIAFLDSYIV